jgi:hypothetical protein
MGQKSLHVDVYHWRALMKGLYMFPLGMYRDFISLQVRIVHSLHNVELVLYDIACTKQFSSEGRCFTAPPVVSKVNEKRNPVVGEIFHLGRSVNSTDKGP